MNFSASRDITKNIRLTAFKCFHKKGMTFLKRKILYVLISIICMLCLAACKGEENTEDAGKYTASELMDIVEKSITDLPEMSFVDEKSENAENILSYLTEVSIDNIISYKFLYSSEGAAEEIAIIQLKDGKDVKQVVSDLKERLETRRNSFATYNEKEVAKFDAAVVVSKDNYVMLIIGNQAQNGKYAFMEAFK